MVNSFYQQPPLVGVKVKKPSELPKTIDGFYLMVLKQPNLN